MTSALTCMKNSRSNQLNGCSPQLAPNPLKRLLSAASSLQLERPNSKPLQLAAKPEPNSKELNSVRRCSSHEPNSAELKANELSSNELSPRELSSPRTDSEPRLVSAKRKLERADSQLASVSLPKAIPALPKPISALLKPI